MNLRPNSPPEMEPAARAGAAGENAKETDDAAKHKGGRPPVQGNRTGRNPSQAAPHWPEPPGAAALRELSAAWGKARRRTGRGGRQ